MLATREPEALRQRIVIVDDDDEDIYLMRRAILRLQDRHAIDLDLTFLTSGREALSEIERCVGADALPDAVFLDLNMPGVNGFDVLQHCRDAALTGLVRFIVITTSADEEVHREARRLGAHDVYVKPSRLNEMSDLFDSTIFGLA